MNVGLQTLTVLFLFLWALELKGHIESKLELQIKLGEGELRQQKRRGSQVKKKKKRMTERNRDRKPELFYSLTISLCFLSHSSTFQSPRLGFKYFKICANWNDSLLETIKWFKQINNIVWDSDCRGTYHLTTQAPVVGISFRLSETYLSFEQIKPLQEEAEESRTLTVGQYHCKMGPIFANIKHSCYNKDLLS